MSSMLCYSQTFRPVSNTRTMAVRHFYAAMALFLCVLHPTVSRAGDAPAWMHAAARGQLPKVDDRTDAVTIYSEDITIVHSEGKVKTIERRAYKILRPGGKGVGVAQAIIDSNSKINGMRAWCIPAQGKDYEVKDTEAVEVSLGGTESMELATDVKLRLLKIPAAEPGNVVGYEIAEEKRPYILQDWWDFQTHIPVQQARYSLQL